VYIQYIHICIEALFYMALSCEEQF